MRGEVGDVGGDGGEVGDVGRLNTSTWAPSFSNSSRYWEQ